MKLVPKELEALKVPRVCVVSPDPLALLVLPALLETLVLMDNLALKVPMVLLVLLVLLASLVPEAPLDPRAPAALQVPRVTVVNLVLLATKETLVPKENPVLLEFKVPQALPEKKENEEPVVSLDLPDCPLLTEQHMVVWWNTFVNSTCHL